MSAKPAKGIWPLLPLGLGTKAHGRQRWWSSHKSVQYLVALLKIGRNFLKIERQTVGAILYT